MIEHKIVLAHRHYGVHRDVKECTVQVKASLLRKAGTREVAVREKVLLGVLPSDFLPVAPNKILLMTMDPGGHGGTAVSDPDQFRSWGKYFDAYSLTVSRGRRVK